LLSMSLYDVMQRSPVVRHQVSYWNTRESLSVFLQHYTSIHKIMQQAITPNRSTLRALLQVPV